MFKRVNQKNHSTETRPGGKRARYARPILAVALVSIVVMAAVLVKVLAADGDLDPSFNTDGKVTTNFSGPGEQAHALAIQSDGKIVAAGYAAPVPLATAGGNEDF